MGATVYTKKNPLHVPLLCDIAVGFLDPQMMVQLTSNPAVAGVADDAGQRLERARKALATGG